MNTYNKDFWDWSYFFASRRLLCFIIFHWLMYSPYTSKLWRHVDYLANHKIKSMFDDYGILRQFYCELDKLTRNDSSYLKF